MPALLTGGTITGAGHKCTRFDAIRVGLGGEGLFICAHLCMFCLCFSDDAAGLTTWSSSSSGTVAARRPHRSQHSRGTERFKHRSFILRSHKPSVKCSACRHTIYPSAPHRMSPPPKPVSPPPKPPRQLTHTSEAEARSCTPGYYTPIISGHASPFHTASAAHRTNLRPAPRHPPQFIELQVQLQVQLEVQRHGILPTET